VRFARGPGEGVWGNREVSPAALQKPSRRSEDFDVH